MRAGGSLLFEDESVFVDALRWPFRSLVYPPIVVQGAPHAKVLYRGVFSYADIV